MTTETATTAPAGYQLAGNFFIKLSHDGAMTLESLQQTLAGVNDIIKSCAPILSEVYKEKVSLDGLAIGSIKSGSSEIRELKLLLEKALPFLKDMDPKIVIAIVVAVVAWKGLDLFISGGSTNNLIGNDITIENNAPISVGGTQIDELKTSLLQQYPGAEKEIDAVLQASNEALKKKPALFKNAQKGLVKLKAPGGHPISAITVGNEGASIENLTPIITQEQINHIPDKYEESARTEEKGYFPGVLLNITRMSKNNGEVTWAASVEKEEGTILPPGQKQLIINTPELQSQLFSQSFERPFRATIYAVFVRDKKGNPDYKRYILESID